MCWVLAGAASPTPAGLAEVMAALRQVDEVEADYTETLESALLSTVVSSRGRIGYRAPDRIRKTGEAGESVEIDGERILVRRGEEIRELGVADHPGVERLVVALRAVFAGDIDRLERDYRLDFAGTLERWELGLRPRDRQLLGLFESIRIGGQGAAISRIDIEEPNGDRRSMEIDLPAGRPSGRP